MKSALAALVLTALLFALAMRQTAPRAPGPAAQTLTITLRTPVQMDHTIHPM